MAGASNLTAPDNKVASQAMDGRGNPIPAVGFWTFQDATGTPKVSPVALTTGVTTIALPTGCIGVSIYADGDAILYGDNSNLTGTTGQTTGKGCDIIPNGSKEFVHMNDTATLKMRAQTTTANAWIKYAFAGSAA